MQYFKNLLLWLRHLKQLSSVAENCKGMRNLFLSFGFSVSDDGINDIIIACHDSLGLVLVFVSVFEMLPFDNLTLLWIGFHRVFKFGTLQ